MVCRLDGAKPLSQPMLEYCQLGPWEENAFENVVCEMASICLGLNVLKCVDSKDMLSKDQLESMEVEA